MATNEPTALAAFLQASRARISPEDAGLRGYGERRRVAGLRREEVAMLAGVSVSYYTRLEQGQSSHASPQVIDALASALRLDAAEQAHLKTLAAQSGRHKPAKRPAPERPDAALLELLASLGDVPALVLGRRSDVLAWNRMGHALVASHLDPGSPSSPSTRPNMAGMVFLDEHTRALYADWRAKSRAVVGNLRLVVGDNPDDPILASLIGSLTMASTEFATLWADVRVQACATAVYEFDHPLVGTFSVTQQTLRSIDHPDQTLVTHTAGHDSDAAVALRLLAQLLDERQGAIAVVPRSGGQ
jgi:transcriptional regulator with XRE-family HTH domain